MYTYSPFPVDLGDETMNILHLAVYKTLELSINLTNS